MFYLECSRVNGSNHMWNSIDRDWNTEIRVPLRHNTNNASTVLYRGCCAGRFHWQNSTQSKLKRLILPMKCAMAGVESFRRFSNGNNSPGNAPGSHIQQLVTAPGLQAIYSSCRKIYPDQPNPLQVTAVVKFWYACSGNCVKACSAWVFLAFFEPSALSYVH